MVKKVLVPYRVLAGSNLDRKSDVHITPALSATTFRVTDGSDG